MSNGGEFTNLNLSYKQLFITATILFCHEGAKALRINEDIFIFASY